MPLLTWMLWYKKPEYRDIKEYSNAIAAGKRTLSPDGRKSAVPARLRLERVLENKTCSPMSLYDFHMYLKYIEFSPENLEFFVWFKSYKAQWTSSHDAASVHSAESTATLREKDPEIAEALASIADLLHVQARCAPVPTPRSQATERSGDRRAELAAVVQTFLCPGAEKELNISPSLRDAALAALMHSPDPAALQPIADHVYALLRNCSHRNFVRLGVANGTVETICMATSLGIALTLAGVLCVLLRGLTPHLGAHTRCNALAAWPLWWIGGSFILSGLRGSCFFLLLFSRRQPLPWERFDDSASVASPRRTGLLRWLSRLMIFDRKLRVADAHLRRLQHRIVVQSLVFGGFFATAGVVVCLFLPIWTETVRK